MGRNMARKRNGVEELWKLNCFDATKYTDNGNVLYELRYEDYEIETFEDYDEMVEYVKNFDYSLFYQENWKEILDERIREHLAFLSETTQKKADGK